MYKNMIESFIKIGRHNQKGEHKRNEINFPSKNAYISADETEKKPFAH